MKKQLLSLLYLCALGLGANTFAYDEHYNEPPKKDEEEDKEKPEGEVEEAKSYFNLSENVDSFDLGVIKNIVGRPFYQSKLIPEAQLHPLIREIVEKLGSHLEKAGQRPNVEGIKNIIGRPFYQGNLIDPQQLHKLVNQIVEDLMKYLQSGGQQGGPQGGAEMGGPGMGGSMPEHHQQQY
jgi:hypothetical protein